MTKYSIVSVNLSTLLVLTNNQRQLISKIKIDLLQYLISIQLFVQHFYFANSSCNNKINEHLIKFAFNNSIYI